MEATPITQDEIARCMTCPECGADEFDVFVTKDGVLYICCRDCEHGTSTYKHPVFLAFSASDVTMALLEESVGELPL